MNESEPNNDPRRRAHTPAGFFKGMQDTLGADERKRICAENMRIARILAPIVAIIVVCMAALGVLVPEIGANLFVQPKRFAVVSAAMLAACVSMEYFARRYLEGRMARKKAYAALGGFIAMCYVFAIAVSVSSYLTYGRVGIFYVFLIMGSVLFLLNPANQAVVTLGALAALLIDFHLRGIADPVFDITVTSITVAIGIVGTIRYDQQRRWALRTIEAVRDAEIDGLTGLSNRLAFERALSTFKGGPLVVAMTDVDDFKYFNDAYSHDLGDQVLRAFAQALRACFPGDRLFRYGGDEFLVVSRRAEGDAFEADAEKLLAMLRATELQGAPGQRITASLGFAKGEPTDPDELRGLIHLADRKLYDAKRDGKGRVSGGTLAQDDLDRELSGAAALPFRRTFETDELTGLPNMQYFRAYGMRFARHLAQRGDAPVLVYFNLSHFKLVNERRGYRAGNELLDETAEAIQRAFPHLFTARIAEDRFTVICPKRSVEQGVERAKASVDRCKPEPSVELKAGAYAIPLDLSDIGDAYDRAKAACDSIKNAHGQTLRVYDDELDRALERRRYVFEHIGEAIKERRIKVRYQPVYRALTGRMCGAEALVRWEDERYGTIPPGDFIGILESAQQISELDSYVVARVCDDLSAARADGLGVLPVSVNFSRIDFQLVDVAELVEEQVQRCGLPRQMIRVEVTESAFTNEDERLARQIARLRGLGYQVWMDDFGAGYSSLSQLNWHDFDVAKIDMTFLRTFDDAQTRNMLASIVDMVKRLGVQTLVEGVETEEQYLFMRKIGCELIQGFYFSKPLPLEDVRALVAGPADGVEPFEQRGYYDAIGRVNPLSQVPFAFTREEAAAPADNEGVTLAVAERTATTFSYLAANDSYRELMAHLGMSGLGDSARYLSAQMKDSSSQIAQLMRTIDRSSTMVSADFVARGDECVLHARRIASYDGKVAVLVSIDDHSREASHTLRNTDVAMGFIYSLYERVDMVNRETGDAVNVYLRAVDPAEVAVGESDASFDSDAYVSALVHPDDRARYRRFIDPATFGERLDRSRSSFLADAFRMLLENGLYTWKTLLAVPVNTHEGSYFMLCRRSSDFHLADLQRDGGNELGDSLLWNAALDLLPEKIFWKDADRRFAGVNRAFLEYYGFASEGDVLGRTDEDMGWHVDPDPFKRDEIAVLGEGERVQDAVGTCIADGRLRHIVANKAPLVRNGEIKGLIGYFVDVEEQQSSHEKMIAAASRDDETSLLNSLGTVNVLSSFEDNRIGNKTDYGIVYLDVDNLRAINREHGHAFGDRVLAAVGRALAGCILSNGVVGHLRTDEFVVVSERPEKTVRGRKAALDEIARTAAEAIAAIESVDSVPCRPTASAGIALRSEAHSATTMVELAEERMRDKRAARGFAGSMGGAPHLTMSDVRRRMAVLEEHFDAVRLVDPSTCTAWRLSEESEVERRLSGPQRCFARLGRCTRCVDCVCAKAVVDRKMHTKYERARHGLVLMQARYLMVDDTAYALEVITDLNIDFDCDENARERFEAQMIDSETAAYFDRETGAYNRRYLEETMVRLHAGRIAAIDVEELSADDARAAQTARQVVRTIRDNVAANDTVARTSRAHFTVVFDPAEDDGAEDLRAQLERIRAQAAADGIALTIGAVRREGTVDLLVDEAVRTLYQAREAGGLLVVGE